jgi:hypothetical protein
MIKVKRGIDDGVNYPYTYFKCPKCGTEDKFLSVAPIQCLYCLTTLPDIRKLDTDLIYRMDYYKGVS